MINIICSGKIKEKYLEELIDDYKKRISKYHKINIIEIKDENDLIGQVRFEKKEAEIIVSISISKKYRGFNLSYIILQECMQKSKFKNFVAYIKPENIASIKIFEKLNYQFDREIFINNIKLLKYKFGE